MMRLNREPERQPSSLCLYASEVNPFCRLLFLSCISWFLVSPLHAQSVRGLDDDRFVQGLRERQMPELIEHFLENYKTDDPVLKLEMLIEAHKLKAQNQRLGLAERRKAQSDVLETYRKLIAQAPPRHWKSPKWKTDFAEYALTAVLRGDAYFSAAEFVEFGTPTVEQEKIFADLAPEAAAVMGQASDEMFFLVGDLPRRDEFTAEFENTGRWQMLVKDYNDLNLPFYKALAWHYASLLPQPPAVINLADAEASLVALVDRGGMSPVGVARAQSLLGRIRLRLDKTDQAAEALDAALAVSGADPFDLFFAQLARAQVLVKQGKKDEALGLLEGVADGETAAKSPLLLILVFDARYRVTQDAGEYTKLLAHSAAAPARASIQDYINRRIVERNPVALDGAPGSMSIEGKTTLEVMAQVDALMSQAQSGGGEKGKALAAATKLLEALLKRGGLPPADEATARFTLGMARAKANQGAGAVEAWLELANTLPDRPEAEFAAINAARVSGLIYKDHPDNPHAAELREKSLLTLLDKYPHAQVGPDQPASTHWYTLGAFYRERALHDKAIDAYTKVTPDHPFYPDALYESLTSRFALWLTAEGEQKKQLADIFVPAADRALQAIAQANPGDDQRREKLMRLEGDTVLLKSQVAAESLGQAGAVKVALAEFETKYGRFADLVAAKRQLMVSVLLQLGQVQEAKAEVDKFKATNPDEAGPLINGVLETLRRQRDDAQKVNRNDPRIAELRQAGLDMARDLVDWAQRQPSIAKDSAKLLGFQDIYGRELIGAGECEQAVKLYEQLAAKDFGGGKTGADQVNVLLGLGKAYLCARQYDKALAPLRKIAEEKPLEFTDAWWDAWLTFFRALDAQYDELAKTDPSAAKLKRDRNIFLSIQKLERRNESMGGPEYKSEFTRLRNKNAPK